MMEPGLDEPWLRAMLEENKRLQGSYMFQYALSLELGIKKLKEELEQVKVERDEAINKYTIIRNHLESILSQEMAWRGGTKNG